MKKIAISLACLWVLGAAAQAADFKVDPSHSNVGFTVRHLFSRISGSFNEFEGTFTFDEKSPDQAKVKFSIKTESINTQNEKRDKHLRSDAFFDADNHPALTFEGKRFAKGKKKGSFVLEGDLTMRGVTKPTKWEVEFLGSGPGLEGKTLAGFTAKAKVNRKDYGINWNKTLDQGGLVVGEDVDLVIQVEAVKIEAVAKKD